MRKLKVLPSVGVMAVLCLVLQSVSGQDFLNLNTEIQIAPADKINSKNLEFAPAYYGSGLVFVHAKDNPDQMDKRLGMSYFELMYAEFGPDGMPGRARDFSPNIRTRFHEGPVAFTNDLKQIYFSRTNTTNGQSVQGANAATSMKIYLADKGPEDWENIRQLPFCSDDYSVMAPTLSPDNMQLIFMSDMPGGYGGMDLYISEKYSGVWSTPVNLGPIINTRENEALPFWHRNNVLFFASDGHPGEGKLDLFASLLQPDGTFSAPVNLGPKFNTRKDDLTFICDAEGKSGFFASSRKEGAGKDDIFHFTAAESIFAPWVVEPILTQMTLIARDRKTLRPIPYASVWLFPMEDGKPTGITEVFDSMPDDQGNYSLRLIPLDNSPVFSYVSDPKGAIPVSVDSTQDYLVVMEADGFRQRRVELRKHALGTGNVYQLDMDGIDDMTADTVISADCLLTSAVVIANASYKPLSNVVVRLRNTCTGQSELLETNSEGRFRACLDPSCDFEVELTKPGFLKETYAYAPRINAEEKVIYLIEADLTERKGAEPVAGDVLILEHLYYDFNKSAIRTGDAAELEALADMMKKYPSMRIELESHTDSRGTADYNLELSEKRGIAARDFLEARGVDESRIILKPMGESRLRNRCADGVSCTEQEHQQNRRTEIHILSVDPALEVLYPDQQE